MRTLSRLFLPILLFTEMWERFSYYGMRALLVLFLTSQLGFSDPKAYAIYSLFAAIGYAGPIIGGVLADKLLGFRNMVIIGGIVMVLGHLVMTFIPIFFAFTYVGLGLIAIGTGLFKGNITNLLGTCYKIEDPNRDRGFTLFYVAINMGSALASITCAYVAQIFGWHYGFALAGIGMLFGLIIFAYYKHIFIYDKPIQKTKLKIGFIKIPTMFFIFVASIVASFISAYMLVYSKSFANVLSVVGCGLMIYTGYLLSKMQPNDRQNVVTLLVLSAFFTMFFALELQTGSLFNLFTARNVDLNLWGYDLPPAVSQALNPLSIIFFGPIVASLFVKKGLSWSMKRFSLGLIAMASCFLVLYLGCLSANEKGLVAYPFLVLALCLMGLGELFIAPLMQNLYTIFSPEKYRGFLMGVLMFCLSFANLAGNIIAKFMSIKAPAPGKCNNNFESLAIYQNGFYKILLFNCSIVLLFTLLIPILNKRLANTIKQNKRPNPIKEAISL